MIKMTGSKYAKMLIVGLSGCGDRGCHFFVHFYILKQFLKLKNETRFVRTGTAILSWKELMAGCPLSGWPTVLVLPVPGLKLPQQAFLSPVPSCLQIQHHPEPSPKPLCPLAAYCTPQPGGLPSRHAQHKKHAMRGIPARKRWEAQLRPKLTSKIPGASILLKKVQACEIHRKKEKKKGKTPSIAQKWTQISPILPHSLLRFYHTQVPSVANIIILEILEVSITLSYTFVSIWM